MIFDFWKKKATETKTDSLPVDNNVVPLYNYPSYEDTNNPGKVPPMPTLSPSKAKEALYTIGTTTDGQTVLKVGDLYTTTLTMNEAAVRQLIRLLEATLTDESENEEDN